MKNKKDNILYLCHRIPYPPNKGDKIRSFNEIKFLAKKFTLDLISLVDNPDDFKYKENLEKYCRNVKIFPLNTKIAKFKGFLSLAKGKSITQGYFYSQEFQKSYDQWSKDTHYKAVICFSSPMAEYVLKSQKIYETNNLKPSYIMDFCDLDSDKWLQYSKKASFPLNILYRLEGKRLLDYEKAVNKVFDKSLFVSKNELALFLRYFPEAKNCSVVPNGVDHNYFSGKATEVKENFTFPLLVFSGAMDYYANIDGVIWFVKEVLPAIKEVFPGTKFIISGSHPQTSVKALEKDPAVTVTGFVPDIRKYYKAADICIVPLRIARGVQNKVLEAMSMGKAVVSTSQAVQGICAEPDKDLVVADNPDSFAQAVIGLLVDRVKLENIGASARNFTLKNHNWSKNLSRLL
jgi:sugar transferase (PEP-CTERM/EpsH1 system associated)